MTYYLGGALGGMIPVYLIAALIAYLLKEKDDPVSRRGRLLFSLPISVGICAALYMFGAQAHYMEGVLLYGISAVLVAIGILAIVKD